MATRYIGIRHRVKRTAEGEAKPTQVCVIVDGESTMYDLATETDELDWMLGRFPRSWRLAVKNQDEMLIEELKQSRQHHLNWKKIRKNQDQEELEATNFVEKVARAMCVLEIPDKVEGFEAGDQVCMTLGGSGDRFAFALSRRAEELGAGTKVMRVKPAVFKDVRERLQRNKDNDAGLLAEMHQHTNDLYLTERRDRDLIKLVEVWRNRIEAMKARIGSEQRLRSHLIGKIFCSEEGKYPEGAIEVQYEYQRSNDKVVSALEEEEKQREREVVKVLNGLDVYNELFKPVKGLGHLISARIIVAVGDIRRFATAAKLKAFIGAHVKRGGMYGEPIPRLQFPRKRSGEVANWQSDGRQAIYLLVDQFNRNPDSPWGLKLREYKVKFREKHGQKEPVKVRAGLVDAYRAVEQWFLEAGLEDSVMGYREIGSYETFKQWVDDGMHKLVYMKEAVEHRRIDIEPSSLVDINDLRSRIAALKPKDEGAMTIVYSDGHIHRMASQRTGTKFVEWLWREWTRFEERNKQVPKAA